MQSMSTLDILQGCRGDALRDFVGEVDNGSKGFRFGVSINEEDIACLFTNNRMVSGHKRNCILF